MSVERKRMANIGRRRSARQRHAAVALVGPEDVVVAPRIVEFLRLRLDEHVIVRQLAEVDRRLGDLQVDGRD